MQLLLQWICNVFTYSEWVLVALRIRDTMHMRQIVICGLPAYMVFPHNFTNEKRTEKKMFNVK